ncbi:hypothetical protein [Streptomyces sp. NPDC049906]|uniref:hypothetical protein n=1 Tax=Streptomyces sp. NPDC049906 TaxID=3155656 RepID=UPI00343B9200
MSARRRGRAGRAWAGGAGLLALVGCGVQATDVIEAGGPATVYVAPGQDNWLLLFFRGPNGELVPVARSTTDWGVGPTGPQAERKRATGAILDLLRGPTEEERAAGLRTALPRPGSGAVNAAPGRGDVTEVYLSLPLETLDDTAVEQLICTVAYAEHPTGVGRVALRGPDVTLAAAPCGIDVNRDEVPRPRSTTLPRRDAKAVPTQPEPPAEDGQDGPSWPAPPPPTRGATDTGG